MKSFILETNLIDIHQRRLGYGSLEVSAGVIKRFEISEEIKHGLPFILPGFIDAHIHIESSMLTPPAFARMAVRHGTVATVSDPHEIANVCGIEGVRLMAELGRESGFLFHFGAPSCVPATSFETAGASLLLSDIRELFEKKEVGYLAEMMNYPAVINRDPLVMDKISLAQEYGLVIDGHAPGLKGKDAAEYASAGITTDHECTSMEEAVDKLKAGMKIIIREGSAAKNFDALHPLISNYPDLLMFCSDDKHPDDLIRGHINEIVVRALELGYDLFDVLKISCINPCVHYGLPLGQLRVGDRADFMMVSDLTSFKILSTWTGGVKVFDGDNVFLPEVKVPPINHFGAAAIEPRSLRLYLKNEKTNIIKAIDRSIVTGRIKLKMPEGFFESDISNDILKIAVVNRYHSSPPAVALIQGFGLTKGAIASSVAHDSHNIIAVGTNDQDLATCVNSIIDHRGGISACEGENVHILPLPVAGLMSDQTGEVVGNLYRTIDEYVRLELQSALHAPYMTLSFMALLVIPSLKISDHGLFDGEAFSMLPLQ